MHMHAPLGSPVEDDAVEYVFTARTSTDIRRDRLRRAALRAAAVGLAAAALFAPAVYPLWAWPWR